MTWRCYWVKDKTVPGGKYLVPGCMNRAINGDYAECHCPKVPRKTLVEKVETLTKRVEELERKLAG